ncbi:MAG: hypothetical protein KIT73_05340 [Burkholderiales bacterium]|nr:hypothetical protein [Burkholderiales bacterium]
MIRLLCAATLLVALNLEAAEPAVLQFPVGGFSIQALEERPGNMTRQALVMALPATGDFAANVNVQIQPFDGSLDEYVALSEEQFRAMGLQSIGQQRPDANTVVFEYTGELQGRRLHWYSRAERAPGRIYLATATATEQQWRTDGARLKTCVDSLRRTGDSITDSSADGDVAAR